MDVPDDLQDILRTHLPFADNEPLTAEQSLSDLGLDSMGLVALMADLEDHYLVELPDEFVAESTFESVGALWQALLLVPR